MTEPVGETWVARVEFDGEDALVVEHGRHWWVLCPAAATLHMDVATVEDDPTSPDTHGARPPLKPRDITQGESARSRPRLRGNPVEAESEAEVKSDG